MKAQKTRIAARAMPATLTGPKLGDIGIGTATCHFDKVEKVEK